MTDLPDSAERAPDAITDELLSAELDGELDAAAIALGLSSAAARAIVDGGATRLAALRAARDLMSAPPPALDELGRRRVITAALSAAVATPTGDSAGRRRLYSRFVGVAAALVVVVGVATLLSGVGGDRKTDSSASRGTNATGAAALASGPQADLGEVSDPVELRSRLRGLTPPAPTAGSKTQYATDPTDAPAPSESSTDSPRTAVTTQSVPPGLATAEAGPDQGSAGGATGSIDCATTLAADFEDIGAPSLLATATYEGRPAGVLVVTGEAAQLAVVFSLDDCTILETQSLRAP